MDTQLNLGLPWRVEDSRFRDTIADASGNTVAHFAMDLNNPRKVAIPPRIVACVNACAGVEDPAAELARLRRVESAARHVFAAPHYGVDGALDDLRDALDANDTKGGSE